MSTGSNPRTTRSQDVFDVIVIGGGQAGLSLGHHLAKRGARFVILDASDRIGDPWRRRWDSLRLFTPARYDGLDGMPFPAPPDSFPTKDEMGDYLEAYARRFALPVRSGARVERLSKPDALFHVHVGREELLARQVVVAMSGYQRARLPDFASELDPRILQLHSTDYRAPNQLAAGDVLIVGAGNSGAEIAIELARSRRVWMSGRDTGHLPFRIDGFWARFLLTRLLLRFVFHHLLTIRTPMGRKLRPRILRQGGPLIRVRPRDLDRAGVARVPRVVGVREGQPLLVDDRVLTASNVIWCTGYNPASSWIELPVFDDDGGLRHQAGVVLGVPGLYCLGLPFLYSMSSMMIHGVGRDAERIADLIARQAEEHRSEAAEVVRARDSRYPESRSSARAAV